MKILVLAWEFPPRIIGGIARHVAELYPELVALGHEIHLITVEFGKTPQQEVVDGIHLHRVAVAYGNDFFHWVVNMNESMGKYGGDLIAATGDFDLIHAHDWLVGDAAIALKHRFKLPLLATIHATEYGRYNGIYTPTQSYIHSKEAQLSHEAWRVIVCTEHMKRELQIAFHTPPNKLDIIYNGIRAAKKNLDPNFNYSAFRDRFALNTEKIVYYLGRMSYEKGISVLIAAAPRVIAEMNGNAKIVIIGGGNVDHLKEQAWNLGIGHKCLFTGFMPEQELNRFQVIADCAVFPSLYEPFGIVVLESFAARVPVVVSDTCGLPEVVEHGKTGVVTQTNNPDSLAWGILDVLKHPDYGAMLAKNAYEDLNHKFHWRRLAKQTELVCQRVLRERQLVHWS
jgi:glycosyltransferase involved in cell wall biosynthesis